MTILAILTLVTITDTHQYVGKVITSVSYGHIHAFLSTTNVYHQMSTLQTMYDSAGNAVLTPKARDNLDKLIKKHDFNLKKTIKQYDNLVTAFSPVANHTEMARIKRHPVVIAGAVVAVAAIAVALGLSIANRVELENLVDVVEQQAEDMEFIVASIESNDQKINDNFRMLKNDIQKLGNDMTSLHDSLLLSELNNKVLLAHEAFQLYLADLTAAVYMAYSGQLHPTLMPVDELTAAFQRIDNMAKRRGGKVVPTLQAQEVLFAMPVTIVTNKTGFHLLVPVPVMPAGMDVLDLYSLHEPTARVDDHTMASLDVGNGLIASSPLRDTHVELSEADFNRCRRFKDYFFCGNLIHQKIAKTCKAAVLLHDTNLMTKVCRKKILHQDPILSQNKTTMTFTTTQTGLLVKQRCPLSPDHERVFKTTSYTSHFSKVQGCYLDTTFADYFPDGPDLGELYMPNTTAFDLELILGEIKREEVTKTIQTLKNSKKLNVIDTDFDEIRQHIFAARARLHGYGHWSLSSVALLLVVSLGVFILGRYFYLRRQGQNVNQQDNQN